MKFLKKTWALNGSKGCVNSAPYLLDYKIENLCPYQIAIMMLYFMNGISWKHVFPIIQRISGDSFTLIENTEFSTSPRGACQSHRAGRFLHEWYVALSKLGSYQTSWWWEKTELFYQFARTSLRIRNHPMDLSQSVEDFEWNFFHQPIQL